MPRKRSKREKIFHKAIAKQRISKLFELAEQEALNNRLDRADRYVELAREIGMKYLVRIPKRYRVLVCKNCHRFLLPGITSRVRTNRNKLVVYCYHCGSYYRVPLKEKSSAILK